MRFHLPGTIAVMTSFFIWYKRHDFDEYLTFQMQIIGYYHVALIVFSMIDCWKTSPTWQSHVILSVEGYT